MTLRNWRKEKPNLYRIVMLGFAFEEAIRAAEAHHKELQEAAKKATER